MSSVVKSAILIKVLQEEKLWSNDVLVLETLIEMLAAVKEM